MRRGKATEKVKCRGELSEDVAVSKFGTQAASFFSRVSLQRLESVM